MTSIKSKIQTEERKKMVMFNFKTNVPELDSENTRLFQASDVLESLGNDPGLTIDALYAELAGSNIPAEDFQAVALAAISIETMISYEIAQDDIMYKAPTVH